MQRTQAVAGQLGGPRGRPPSLAEAVWARRNRLLQALEPHLSDLARELLRKEYRKVLPKILEARGLYKQRFRAIERGASPGEAARTRAGFRECLEEKLHEISSGMLGELADRVALRLEGVGEENLLARAIRIYSSVTGSYQQRLTLLQRLSPNIRTLSYIESEMVQHSGDRELSGSIWVLLYIFSFAFVQMFGKYITRAEREEVLRVVKTAFARGVAIVAGGIEREGEGVEGVEGRVDGWIEELSRRAGTLPSL